MMRKRPSAKHPRLRRWSAEEDAVLADAVREQVPWNDVPARLRDACGTVRTVSACQQRWNDILARRHRVQLAMNEAPDDAPHGTVEVAVTVNGVDVAKICTPRTLRELLAFLAEPDPTTSRGAA